MPIGAGAYIGGAIIGGLADIFGQSSANKANLKIAREQMDFQERMSNTAYQRSVEDLKKAGINPILAFQQGGASTPSGASSAGSSATMMNEFAGAISSALQARSMSAQIDQVKATTDLLKAELPAKKVEAEIYNSKYGKALRILQLVANPMDRVVQMFRR